MRKSFPGFYRPSEEEFKKLWDKCTFVLDANVLLNLYRYTDKTRLELMSLLDLVKDRLWLPFQAGYEFHRNRLKVISDQEEAYEKLIKNITETQKKLDNDLNAYSKHPLINSKDIKKKISDDLGKIQNDLERAKKNHPNVSEKDDVIDFVTALFDGKVGQPYSREKLKSLYELADKRYKEEIPPGFKDSKDKSGDQKYGDFVIWQQIIEKARKIKTPIILVTDDAKEDWWRQFKGRTLGPRPELIEEIKSEADVDFYMYQTDPFMEYASSHFNKILNKDAVEEVKMVRDQYLKDFESFEKLNQKSDFIREAVIKLNEELNRHKPNDYILGNQLLLNWLKDPDFNPNRALTIREWLNTDFRNSDPDRKSRDDKKTGEDDEGDPELVE